VSAFGLRLGLGSPVTRDNSRWNWVLKDETGELYARTLTRFAAAAIRSLNRSEDRFRLPLTNMMRSKASQLFEALKSLPGTLPAGDVLSPGENSAVLKLQEFFYTSVTDSLRESVEDKFKCPVMTYAACFAYNEDDTFKVAHQVTSMLAQWSFLLRANALYYAKLKSENGGPEASAPK